ncbi:MAG: hypothetical protein ACLPN5_12900 [Roseiarcus sp.]
MTTPDFDRFVRALALLSLAFYLAPSAFGSVLGGRRRRWMLNAAIATLTAAVVVAVVAEAARLFP